MKLYKQWWLPDHELHLQKWMDSSNNKVVLNGRQAYQGHKQIATLGLCNKFRTAIDIGAHIGLWTYNLMFNFYKVHAFEPLDVHRDCFHKNIDTEGFNVTLHDCALGEKAKTVSLNTLLGNSGSTVVKDGNYVTMLPLDTFVLTEVDLIKIDCEGYEENILRGATNTINRCKPTIIVEQKPDSPNRYGSEPLGAVKYLKSLKYTVVKEISGDYIMVIPK